MFCISCLKQQLTVSNNVNRQSAQTLPIFFVYFYLLTNVQQCVKISGRRALARSRFPLYHSPRLFVNRKFAQRSCLIFPEFCAIFLLTFGVICGTIIVSRGTENEVAQASLMCEGSIPVADESKSFQKTS